MRPDGVAALPADTALPDRKTPPLEDPPREREVTYLAPRLVAQIASGEWTNDRKLRQPVFLGLYDDIPPAEVALPEAT